MFRPLKPVRRGRGLTMVELLVAIAVAGILLVIAVPSFQDFMLMQRLRGVNAQLVTDIQYTRAEAPSRNQYVSIRILANESLSCYVIFTSTQTPALRANRCDCRSDATSTCQEGATAIKTVRLPLDDGVRLRVGDPTNPGFAYDHVAGGIVRIVSDRYGDPFGLYRVEAYIDDNRVLRNDVSLSGRINTCAPASTSVGAQACPEE
jgi:type IV fimbrial biogenesis protein FimT